MAWGTNQSFNLKTYVKLTDDIAALYRGRLARDLDLDKKKLNAIINQIVTSATSASPYHVKVDGISDLETVILLIEHKEVLSYYNIDIGYIDRYSFSKDYGVISKRIHSRQTYVNSKLTETLPPECHEELEINVRYLGEHVSLPITATRVYELNTYTSGTYEDTTYTNIYA